MSLRIGDFLTSPDGGVYEVSATHEAGGMGATCFVTEQSTGSEYVAKAPLDINNAVDRKCIELEFRVISELEKSGVQGIMIPKCLLSFDSPNGSFPVLIVEKARGITLAKATENSGLPYGDVADILSKVAESMSGVHQSGYMHLDLSPDNIMIDDAGGANEITIIDFGVAARKSDSGTFAVSRDFNAKKKFFSPPEQIQNQPSQRSDLFSLGAVGFSLILGQKKTFELVMRADKDPPHDLDYHIPPKTQTSEQTHLHAVIKKATWPDKGGRFATMEEMSDFIAGKEPDTNFPRIIADSRVFRLTGEGPWTIGRDNPFGDTPEIPVKETSVTEPYISRKHAVISRRPDGVLVLSDTGSVNGTRARIGQGSKTRWRKLPGSGFPMGSRYQEFCLGYANHPPGNAMDKDGNPVMPGPYKTIEFEPPEPDSDVNQSP